MPVELAALIALAITGLGVLALFVWRGPESNDRDDDDDYPTSGWG